MGSVLQPVKRGVSKLIYFDLYSYYWAVCVLYTHITEQFVFTFYWLDKSPDIEKIWNSSMKFHRQSLKFLDSKNSKDTPPPVPTVKNIINIYSVSWIPLFTKNHARKPQEPQKNYILVAICKPIWHMDYHVNYVIALSCDSKGLLFDLVWNEADAITIKLALFDCIAFKTTLLNLVNIYRAFGGRRRGQ